jgi:hypothetical protein
VLLLEALELALEEGLGAFVHGVRDDSRRAA